MMYSNAVLELIIDKESVFDKNCAKSVLFKRFIYGTVLSSLLILSPVTDFGRNQLTSELHVCIQSLFKLPDGHLTIKLHTFV